MSEMSSAPTMLHRLRRRFALLCGLALLMPVAFVCGGIEQIGNSFSDWLEDWRRVR